MSVVKHRWVWWIKTSFLVYPTASGALLWLSMGSVIAVTSSYRGVTYKLGQVYSLLKKPTRLRGCSTFGEMLTLLGNCCHFTSILFLVYNDGLAHLASLYSYEIYKSQSASDSVLCTIPVKQLLPLFLLNR